MFTAIRELVHAARQPKEAPEIEEAAQSIVLVLEQEQGLSFRRKKLPPERLREEINSVASSKGFKLTPAQFVKVCDRAEVAIRAKRTIKKRFLQVSLAVLVILVCFTLIFLGKAGGPEGVVALCGVIALAFGFLIKP